MHFASKPIPTYLANKPLNDFLTKSLKQLRVITTLPFATTLFDNLIPNLLVDNLIANVASDSEIMLLETRYKALLQSGVRTIVEIVNESH